MSSTVSSDSGVEAHVVELHDRRRTQESFDAELDEVAGFVNAQTGRLVELTRRMLDEPLRWQGPGLETPEKYLAWRVGISPTHAKRIVAIARRAEELPVTMAAFEAGELSEDQVWPIVKSSPAWADEQSASYAKRMTVVQIQRTMRTYPFDSHATDQERAAAESTADEAEQAEQLDPAGDERTSTDDTSADLPPQPDDICWYGETEDGRWRLHVETDLAAGLKLESVLDERRDRIFQEAGVPADGVQALLALAQQSIDQAPAARAERARVGVFISIDGDQAVTVDRLGRALPDHVAAQLCCDGIITPVLVENGVPVSVGRSQRIVPERTRRIVEHRDRGCRAPGCTRQHHLEIHHIVHWGDDGPTDTWNLVCLCPHHHRLHHQGRMGISGNADDPDGLAFTDARGRPIPQSGASPRPPGGPPPPIAGTWEHPLGEPLHMKWLAYFRRGVDDVVPLPGRPAERAGDPTGPDPVGAGA